MARFLRTSFQAKLLLSFALVIILTMGFGYFLVSRAIDRAFENFALRTEHRQAAELVPLLADYYERTGSWEGLASLLEGRERFDPGPPAPFALVDRDGTVIFAPDERLVGRELPPHEPGSGIPIEMGGRTVATLVVLSPPRGPLEEEFASSVQSALWLTGLAAGGIALLLGFGLLHQLTRPLHELTAATRKIARGQLSQRVSVRSADELGQLAQSFNEMAASLEQAEETKRRLIADISHELRTPINSLRIGLEALMDGVLPPTPESFASLHNETLLVGRLVADLGQLALADAGQLSIKKQPCDLRRLLQQIQATIGVQLEEQEIKLEIQPPQDLPPLEADVQRLEQVLLNLLSNAMRHTPPGGTIRITARVLDDRSVQISVCDSGPGLSEEDLPHIFERFYRADRSRARASGGSGLGLAIAKALVEAHGGRIWAENAPTATGGACFHFTLPQSAG